MPNSDIAFTISIPIREEDSQVVIDAFLASKPYNTVYTPSVIDFAGNIIDNPITPEMYVEDAVAFYIMDITKNYLINQAAEIAKTTAANQAQNLVDNLRNYINSNSWINSFRIFKPCKYIIIWCSWDSGCLEHIEINKRPWISRKNINVW